MKFRIPKKQKGFTLVEMVTAMSIFAIMVVAVSGAFSSGFLTYSHSRELQQNVEAAQYVVNTLAKELRTSTVVTTNDIYPPTAGKKWAIRFYDHSSLRCFEYWFHAATHDFKAKWKDIPDTSSDPIGDCMADAGFSDATSLATGYIDGKFAVIPSDKLSNPKQMGRVTIQLIVKQKQTSVFESHLQTSVSLRDYNYIEF